MSKLLSDLPTLSSNKTAKKDLQVATTPINYQLFLLIAIFVLTLANTLFIVGTQLGINPLVRSESQQVLDEVASIVDIDSTQTPVIQRISAVDSLRDANPIQAEVYAEARNGDYLIGFQEEMIIYNRNSRQVVYKGPYPNQLANTRLSELAKEIVGIGKNQEIIPADYDIDLDTASQISIVAEPEQLKQTNAEFYADVETGDILLILPGIEKVILFRESTNSIVNQGSFLTSIQ